MTLTNLRRRKRSSVILPSVFPCTQTAGRLRRVNRPEQLGIASVDKVGLKIKERREHFGKPEYFEKEKDGWTYHYRRQFTFSGRGQEIWFQIYIGRRSPHRTLLVNPRHFLSFDKPIPAFVTFVGDLFDIGAAKVTRIDLSFQIYRHLVSCDFFRWCMFVDGAWLTSVKAVPYSDPVHAYLAKAEFESYIVGKKPLSAQVYDCDAKSSKGKTNQLHESMTMQGVYNLEFRLHRDNEIVKNVKTVNDVFKIDIGSSLAKVYFVDPSRVNRLRDTEYQSVIPMWGEKGIQFARRKAYSVKNKYPPFDKLLTELKIKGMTFKQALIELAEADLSQYQDCGLDRERQKKKSIGYYMPMIFPPK